MGFMGTRLSTDLGDPRLLKLLKIEANERGTTVKEVLSRALISPHVLTLDRLTPGDAPAEGQISAACSACVGPLKAPTSSVFRSVQNVPS